MNILDKRFKYVKAVETDIRKTFAKAKKELDKVEKQKSDARQAAIQCHGQFEPILYFKPTLRKVG